MRMGRRLGLIAVSAGVTLTAWVCGGDHGTPTSPKLTTVRVDVGVLGDATPRLQPGDTLQFWAEAAEASGSKSDVTNLATWSSSNTAVATVSAGGLVSGVTQGTAAIKATYDTLSGQIDTQISILACSKSTLTPASRVYSPWGFTPCSDDDGVYGQKVNVATAPACTWTASSDVPWLGIDCYAMRQTFTPTAAGSGSFSYGLVANNTPSARSGHITVTFSDGTRISHSVTEEQPSCSYLTSPVQSTVPKAGGTGSFDVQVSPSTCAWSVLVPLDMMLSPSSGVGAGHIDYRVVTSNPYPFDRQLTIGITPVGDTSPGTNHKVFQSQ